MRRRLKEDRNQHYPPARLPMLDGPKGDGALQGTAEAQRSVLLLHERAA
jgi:hypothetical protein